jgi:hypothetical protein
MALTLFLQIVLDPERTGKFQLSFKWISLRFGLDQNMLVISGFQWSNPSEFTNTPCFIHIEEVSLSFDPWSVYEAVMHNKPIKIKEIRLFKARVHLEKLTQKSVERSVAGSPDARRTSSVGPASPASVTGLGVSTEQSGEQQRRTKTREPLKPGMLNLWAAMGARDPREEMPAVMKKVLSDAVARVRAGAQSAWNSLPSCRKPATAAPQGAPHAGAAVSSNQQSAQSEEEVLAALQREQPDLVLSPLPEDASDEEDRQHQAEAEANSADPQAAPKQDTARTRKSKGFGVPYKFEVDFILVHDFKLHTRELDIGLGTSDSVIKLGTFGMSRDELTLPPNQQSNGYRRGIYLDSVVMRLVTRLLVELLSKNFVNLTLVLSAVTRATVTSVIRQAATSTKDYALAAVTNAVTSVVTSSNVSNSIARDYALSAVTSLLATTETGRNVIDSLTDGGTMREVRAQEVVGSLWRLLASRTTS